MIQLTKELLTDEPEKMAKDFNGKDTTESQLRKFYNDFLVLKTKTDLCADEDEFKTKILPLIFFSKAKLAYSCGRGNITKDFQRAICAKIDEIETRACFDNFLKFYEALIGYTKYSLMVKKHK